MKLKWKLTIDKRNNIFGVSPLTHTPTKNVDKSDSFSE